MCLNALSLAYVLTAHKEGCGGGRGGGRVGHRQGLHLRHHGYQKGDSESILGAFYSTAFVARHNTEPIRVSISATVTNQISVLPLLLPKPVEAPVY